MKYDPARHHRRSIRLKGYDYSSPGAYFVTICVHNRINIYGDITGGEMRLNDAGQMVQAAWQALPERFPTVELDEFVVMPNHMHGIIVLTAEFVRAGTSPTPTDAPFPNVGASLVDALNVDAPNVNAPNVDVPNMDAPSVTDRPALGDIVGAFKSITTDEYIQGVHSLGWPPFVKRVWQRNYFEHIVRNERELAAIRRYIRNNPLKWALDRDNLQNIRRLPPPEAVEDYLEDVNAL